MKRKFLIFIAVLNFFLGGMLFSHVDCSAMSVLKSAGVELENNRLTGELKNAPVKDVIKDLFEYQGVRCWVSGDLQGTISMTIDSLTVEETIQKIMRTQRYDYTMVMVEDESTAGSLAAVSELTIYQNNKVVRFVKISQDSPLDQPVPIVSKSQPDASLESESEAGSMLPDDATLKDLDREIQSLMDEMLSRGEISQSEYDEAMRTIIGEDE